MAASWHRRLRLGQRALGYLFAGAVIAVALVVGGLSQLMPWVEAHPDRLAAWLSERAGRPVSFDAVHTRWTRRGPLLQLQGLRVGSVAAGTAVALGDVEMLVSQYAGLLPGRSFTELRLRGLELTLERDASGRWQVRGLPGQQQTPNDDPLAALEGLGELQVVAAKLSVLAPELGIRAHLPRVNARVQVHGDRVRAGVQAWMRDEAAPITTVLDIDRRQGNGQAWSQVRQAELGTWRTLLQVAGVQAVEGLGDAQAWLTMHDHRLTRIQVQADVQRLQLQGAPLPGSGAATPASVRFERLNGHLVWHSIDGGWRLDAPQLQIEQAGWSQSLDGLLLAGGQRMALDAKSVDAGPLLAVAALSDRLPADLRRWLLQARPHAALREVRLAGERDGVLQVQGRIERAGFAAVGDAPGIEGIGGQLLGDIDGASLQLDAPQVTFDWPRGFGVPHQVSLKGNVALWREGAGWRIGTPALRVEGRDYSADARGGLWWQGDGSRPWIDLAAELGPAPVPAAKRFWIRSSMPQPAIDWLDMALVDGTVSNGRAVVSGDLDDWPFDDANGLFHASARLQDTTLRFQRDWPPAQNLDGRVDFVADGFRVTGSAAIAGIPVSRFEAGIPHFDRSVLSVEADGAGDASRLLALLRDSPLRRQYGGSIDHLQASGPAQVQFAMELPLYPGSGGPQIDGTVQLQGARLADPRFDLAFDDVQGNAGFSHAGFQAEQLTVQHQGQRGRLTLRAGNGTRDRQQAFEAELQSAVAASTLLERAGDNLAWLKPLITGTSNWTVAVALPKGGVSTSLPSSLQLRSDLVGTRLLLPAPLDKPAATALPSVVDIALPLDDGDLNLALGNRIALRARTRAGQTGIRAVLGSNRVSEAAPASGLIATGNTGQLDALGWAMLATGGSGSKGMPLRSLDITATKLQLIGSTFPATRLKAVPVPAGTAFQFDGAGLAGSVLVPDADGAAISGTLQKLHWRTDATAAPVAEAAAAVTESDSIDPARIPPLALDVADARFGKAALGRVRLRTRPLAGGMRIEQLQATATGQRIDIAGDWTGRGPAARTRLEAHLDSRDVGSLLAGLGMPAQLKGGTGKARLDAAWPGGPQQFALANLNGNLNLHIRDGQLVEVEPGAGRLLGLLGIAQLPRRLTLDFRDLFEKGFSFDKAVGDIRLGDGLASSENLQIKGPAAEIRIHGAANLRTRQFDQTIDVYPRTGNLLTVAGALAGGPVGAAIGAAANAVLQKPIGQMTAKSYRVTGPWKDPQVEVAEHRPRQGGKPPG